MSRTDFAKVKRVVVKIGSSLLTKGGQGLDKTAITAWVEQMAGLRQQSIDVILVSSGSVAEGMCRLGMKARPKTLHELQAAASVGRPDDHKVQVLLGNVLCRRSIPWDKACIR